MTSEEITKHINSASYEVSTLALFEIAFQLSVLNESRSRQEKREIAKFTIQPMDPESAKALGLL